MSASIFREYDIRGIFEKELNEDVVKKIGYYLAKALQKKFQMLFIWLLAMMRDFILQL